MTAAFLKNTLATYGPT